MKRSIIVLSVLFAGGNLFAARLILPPEVAGNTHAAASQKKNPVQNNYQNIKIKNIKTLKQLNESLNEIEKILKQKKLIEQQKQISEEEKERIRKKRMQKELEKRQEQIDYQKKIFQIQQKEKTLERLKFKKSPKYIESLISVLKEKIRLTEKRLKSIKLPEEYPVRVYNVAEVGHSYFGYADQQTIINAASLIEAAKNIRKRIELKIEELEDSLKLINKKIINANPDIFEQKLLSLTDIFQNVRKNLNEIQSIQNKYLSGQTQAAPDMLVLSLYKEPKDVKDMVKIKEGDMVTSDIQVKKIRNGYAILGLINER